MANTIKTLNGEILVSEIESVVLEQPLATLIKSPAVPAKVTVVGKSGIKYDLTASIQSALAIKVYNAALTFVAGTGHTVFDPAQVK